LWYPLKIYEKLDIQDPVSGSQYQIVLCMNGDHGQEFHGMTRPSKLGHQIVKENKIGPQGQEGLAELNRVIALSKSC
jgi:hypothetical protein